MESETVLREKLCPQGFEKESFGTKWKNDDAALAALSGRLVLAAGDAGVDVSGGEGGDAAAAAAKASG